MKKIFLSKAILVPIILIIAIIIGVIVTNNKKANLATNDVTPQVEKVSIRGKITQIVTISEERATILVEGKLEEDTIYDAASVSITKDSTITRIPNSKTLKISDIKIGDTVEVNFDGSVAESYPVQATAKWITIIK